MAVFPVAAGVSSHSGTYTPEVWSGKLLVKFYTATVFTDISNTDYEGEIKSMGDTVHIRTKLDITIRDYNIGQKLIRERPEPSVVDLLIDKGKYYSFVVNKVQQHQSDIPFIEAWSDDAGEQMAIKIDLGLLADVYASASSYNKGATAGYRTSSINLGASGAPLGLDKTNILDFLVDCGTVLDEYDIPQSQRWVILPPIFCGMIKKSDLKDASLSGDGTSILRNGKMGMIDRFTLYSSNQIATTTDGSETVHNVMFGHKCAITFASQLVENRTLPNPDDFGDIQEGLQVYGYKVIKAQGLGHAYVYKM